MIINIYVEIHTVKKILVTLEEIQERGICSTSYQVPYQRCSNIFVDAKIVELLKVRHIKQ